MRVGLFGRLLPALVVGVLGAMPLHGQAIFGTESDGNTAVVLPSPNTALPTPAQTVVPGLPVDARPHGVAYFGSDNALISDFNLGRVFNVQISTASLVSTITTSPAYNGTGTIAVAPGLAHALACGGSATLSVLQAPFAAGATITTVALPGQVASYQTQAIGFTPSGRAFVYTTAGISVLDPPYSSIAFTIPVSGNGNSGALAVSPDGNTLLVTKLTTVVEIFTAPFSAASTGSVLTIAGTAGLDGIQITPDGTKALVAAVFAPLQAFAISAPFTSGSLVEALPIPAACTGGFEDVGISADGQLAVFTGNSAGARLPAAFVRAPFTAAGATSFAVQLGSAGPPDTRGRGTGAVRFLPPGLAPGLTVGKSAPATVAPGAPLTYTVTYGNSGGAAASGVVIRETLPAGTTFVSATGGGTESAGIVTWSVGSLGAGVTGQTVSFTVAVTAQSGSIVNGTYTIEGTGIAPIFGPPVTTQIQAAPAVLAIRKTASLGTPILGAPFTFQIEVTNTGGAPAAAVQVTDDVPAGLAVGSVTIAPSGGCSVVGQLVTCSIPSLAAGAVATITIPVTASVAGPLTNTATAAFTAGASVQDDAAVTVRDADVVAAVPTVSALGLSILALALGAAGFLAIRRAV
jgi:uncharacterized repeat protein (TIGR01451 family)